MRATVVGIEHHLNLRPLDVICDECRVLYRSHHFHQWPILEERERALAALREEGWEATQERQVCPDCVAKC